MAKRQVFYSFHYENDCWRASQVKNMGVIDGNTPVSPNEWEEVKRKGKGAIEKWIKDSMAYRSCVVVLIGSETANREWCNYEIKHAWEEGKGIVGIYIHGLEDAIGKQDKKGANPLSNFCIDKTFNYIAQRSIPQDSEDLFARLPRNHPTVPESTDTRADDLHRGDVQRTISIQP